MKEVTKIVKDKPTVLTPVYDAIQTSINDSDAPLLMVKSNRNYVIVDEFSGIGSASKENKVVFQEASNEVEYDDHGNPIFYAEEIFDEEDDLYSETYTDRAVEKQAHRKFEEIGKVIDTCLLYKGFESKIGFKLLCAMQFSRMLNFTYSENVIPFVEKLFEAISNPHFVIAAKEGETIANAPCLYDAIVHAKNNPNLPTFIYINNVAPKDFYRYLRPVYPYIDNHNGDFYVVTKGRSIQIPKNLFFAYSLAEGQEMADVSRRILRYTSIITPTITVPETKGEYVEPTTISLGELAASFKEASESYGLRESTWKKIDNLIAMINSQNGYALHNKITSRLESYAISRLSNDDSEEEALDDLLTNNFIVEAIICEKPQLYKTDFDIINLIDGAFGMENMKRTKNAIKHYIDLFDKGGKRIND